MVLSNGHCRSLHSLFLSAFFNNSMNSLNSCRTQTFVSPTTSMTMKIAKLPVSPCSTTRRISPTSLHFLISASTPTSQFTSFSLSNSGSRFSTFAKVQGPLANLDQPVEDEGMDMKNLEILTQKIEAYGINCGHLVERSLSFHISQIRDFAMWRCFRFECGWTGQAFIDDQQMSHAVNDASEFQSFKKYTETDLGLEPIGHRLIAYFALRRISTKCLQRNAVMQVSGEQDVIAFTYRQNGVLVGCKYRSINKKFWQEKGTRRILYGLDDIIGASELIIVEGEIDKLSMEEAGFSNCVSVPGGAPQKVSAKELPSWQKDIAYQYIWNCKAYLDKVSRIILATDNDSPGQALAEELARRLGKERCWRVRWPQREDSSYFKDANEVLVNLGPDALRDMIGNVELYT
ncbi:hypothetical protein Ancab_016425 [Ancistrocladus abbreviatus]